MVFEWLFGDRRKQEPNPPEISALFAQADAATNARNAARGELLCRELLKRAPENADAWTMLGVNLIRQDAGNPSVRVKAIIAWKRALTLRPGDARASEHLRIELKHADDLVPLLSEMLGENSREGEDAAALLAQIGLKAEPSLRSVAHGSGLRGERARLLLASVP